MISCAVKEKKVRIETKTEVLSEKEDSFSIFEKMQDSLRIVILNSKPQANLKAIILQELYIRGLVNQIEGKIKFELPFNLHGFDCGAPDCYATHISFEITAKEPIQFPKKIDVKLREHGCGIEHDILENGVFELMEHSNEYVNYYSKKQQSNLVILGKKKKLYYFPDTQPNSIKVANIDTLFKNYNEEDPNAIAPYQSTKMTSNTYEKFIK